MMRPNRVAFSLSPCYALPMQITVEIPDDLAARVQASGITLEAYVRKLIEEAERSRASALPGRRMCMEEFLAAMAANSERIPVLPDEAFTRKSFYQDHD